MNVSDAITLVHERSNAVYGLAADAPRTYVRVAGVPDDTARKLLSGFIEPTDIDQVIGVLGAAAKNAHNVVALSTDPRGALVVTLAQILAFGVLLERNTVGER